MSVINQMLNGLEQRGVQIAAEQVRPVREVRDFRKTIIAVLLVVLVLPGAWFLYRYKGTAPVPVAVVAEVKPELPKPKPRQPAHRSSAAIKEGGKEKQVIKSSAPAAHDVEKADRPVPAHNEKLVQSPPPPPIKQISAAQQADAEFSGASLLMQQGRTAEAQAGFEATLRLDAGHVAARQSLVA
jgi:MSHA biogenesis protein MshN